MNAVIEHLAGQSKRVISGMLSVNDRMAYALFDTSATHSFVSEVFVRKVSLMIEAGERVLMVSLLSRIQILTTRVCKNCEVTVSVMLTKINLIMLQISDFDVILSMDSLEENHASVDCKKKEITFWRPHQRPCPYVGYASGVAVKMISAMKAFRILESEGEAYLASVMSTMQELLKHQDIEIVHDFEDVFLEELIDLPPKRGVDYSGTRTYFLNALSNGNG